MPNETPRQEVVVTDIRMRFLSMVVFMIKWAIASIPALLILLFLGVLTWSLIIGVVASIALGPRQTSVSSIKTASDKRTETEAADPEIAAYINKVIVANFKVGKSTLDEPGVFGEIKNTGDRSLSKVEITIYYLDQNGKYIYEKTYPAVFVSQFSLSGDNKPLKPGYTQGFGVKLNDAPSDWAGKVDVKVTSIAFDAKD